MRLHAVDSIFFQVLPSLVTLDVDPSFRYQKNEPWIHYHACPGLQERSFTARLERNNVLLSQAGTGRSALPDPELREAGGGLPAGKV